ncbi:hypothetical protein P7K49_008182 [Saguinus oedipus]|uniref:40S ribosomal protein S15 n=1 Tax=Saguinus oedipus TaxID=9490 RepID=A0ABQ9VXR2_SAGOE|nr:hypothetical protein P7K49_008182 [Saguinus oedipus]
MAEFTFRGVDLDQLLDMSYEQLTELYTEPWLEAKKEAPPVEKPEVVKTFLLKAKKETPPVEKLKAVKMRLQDMIFLPEMVGSMVGTMVGVCNGKTFNQVEIKPEVTGHYLGEFSITYKPMKHGWPDIGTTHSSCFIPLK